MAETGPYDLSQMASAMIAPPAPMPSVYEFIAPAQIAQQRAYGRSLMDAGMSTDPLQGSGWAKALGALNRGAQGALGGYAMRRAAEAETGNEKAKREAIAAATQGGVDWSKLATVPGMEGASISGMVADKRLQAQEARDAQRYAEQNARLDKQQSFAEREAAERRAFQERQFGEQRAARQEAAAQTAALGRGKVDADMLARGFVPDQKAPGGYRFDASIVPQEAGGGPFSGKAMEAQAANIVLSPNADPSTPAYAVAFNQLYGPRTITQANGDIVTITPPVPEGVRRPTSRAAVPSAAPTGAPAGGAVTTEVPGGGQVSRVQGTTLMPNERKELDKATVNAIQISNALDDFVAAAKNAGTGERAMSVAGVNTPLNTAYNNAALLAKGEELYNLGVLNGPDLDIIRRTLPDPSTFRGGLVADAGDAERAVRQIQEKIQDKINAYYIQKGLPPINLRQRGQAVRGAAPEAGSETYSPAPTFSMGQTKPQGAAPKRLKFNPATGDFE